MFLLPEIASTQWDMKRCSSTFRFFWDINNWRGVIWQHLFKQTPEFLLDILKCFIQILLKGLTEDYRDEILGEQFFRTVFSVKKIPK